MNSMARVLDKHHRAMQNELRKRFKSDLIKEFVLEIRGDCMGISVTAELTDGTSLPVHIDEYDIDTLGERFPDCEVGY